MPLNISLSNHRLDWLKYDVCELLNIFFGSYFVFTVSNSPLGTTCTSTLALFLFSLGAIVSRSEITEFKGMSLFKILDLYFQIAFQKDCNDLHIHQPWTKVLPADCTFYVSLWLSSPESCELCQTTVPNWISNILIWIMCQIRTVSSWSQICSVDQGLDKKPLILWE